MHTHFTHRQILKNEFRRCKPAWQEGIVRLIKGIKVKKREGPCGKDRPRGCKKSTDEKRARFRTKKGQEYGSTTKNIHMCILCKFNIKWTVATEAYKAPTAAAVFPADMVKIRNKHSGLARSIYFGEWLSHQQSPQQDTCCCFGDPTRRCSARFKFFHNYYLHHDFIMVITVKTQQVWIPECPGHLFPYKWHRDDSLQQFPITDHCFWNICSWIMWNDGSAFKCLYKHLILLLLSILIPLI